MRKFGVEVEYIGDCDRVTSDLHAAGLSSRQSRAYYSATSDSDWLNKSDASVHNDRYLFELGDPRRDFSGGEMVSPPLDFDDADARAQVDRAVQILQDSGAFPNDSTGIHVHVDCSDLTWKQVLGVCRLFYKFQDVIYRIASSGHATVRSGAQTYAPALSERRIKAMVAARDISALQNAWAEDRHYDAHDHGHRSRYCGINLHSYFYRGTIEFRVFNGSVNPERIQAYIAMCVAMVEDARRGKSRSINVTYRVGGMHDGTTKADNAYHRFIQVLRYDAGLELVDMKRLNRVWRDSQPQTLSACGGNR